MSQEKKAVTLKTVAARVGLAPCSISAILNDTDAARAIPQATKDRVYRAVSELNYRPNLWARSLRTKRTRMVAVLAPGLGQPSVARVVAAAQRRLHRSGYLAVLHTLDSDGGTALSAQLQQRGIEGVISIDAVVPHHLTLPVTSVNLGAPAVDSVAGELKLWLSELGDSAAGTVIRQIENAGSSRKLTIEAKIPSAYMSIPGVNLAFGPMAESA